MTTLDIRFVYFDLGNILLAFDSAIACRNVATLFGISFEQAEAAIYDSGLEDRFEHGELSPDEFAKSICATIGLSDAHPPPQKLLDTISDMFTPIASMVGVMDRVQCGGRGIGILSNTCHAHWNWIERQSYEVMRANLDAVVLSYEVGAMKPRTLIYEVAERAAGVPAEHILFIDDKPENVEAATERGWHAVQCFGGDEAIGVLREFGLLD